MCASVTLSTARGRYTSDKCRATQYFDTQWCPTSGCSQLVPERTVSPAVATTELLGIATGSLTATALRVMSPFQQRSLDLGIHLMECKNLGSTIPNGSTKDERFPPSEL